MGKGSRNRTDRKLNPELNFADYPPRLQQRIRETARMLAMEQADKLLQSSDETILWALHVGFGWGPVRLRRFYDTYIQLYNEMKERYKTTDDLDWKCSEGLKALGVDLDQWRKDAEPD